MKLRKVRDEVLTAKGRSLTENPNELGSAGNAAHLLAVFAQIPHALSASGGDLLVGALEAFADVLEAELHVLRVLVDPLGVAANDENGRILDLWVGRKRWQERHDERDCVIVVRVHLGTHRPEREERGLDRLPGPASLCPCRGRRLERALDELKGPFEALGRAEDVAAVLEGVAHRVPEAAEVIALLSVHLALVGGEAEVTNDDFDEAFVDLGKRAREGVGRALAERLSELVPEVEGDLDDLELLRPRTDGNCLDEREKSLGVLQNERPVRLTRLDKDAAEATERLGIVPNVFTLKPRGEGQDARKNLLDDVQVVVDFLRLMDEVDEYVDCRVKERIGCERVKRELE